MTSCWADVECVEGPNEFVAAAPDEPWRRSAHHDRLGRRHLPCGLMCWRATHRDSAVGNQVLCVLTGRGEASGDQFGVKTSSTDGCFLPRVVRHVFLEVTSPEMRAKLTLERFRPEIPNRDYNECRR